MVNPGGTGSPMRDISARFAPLPPSNGFIEPFPSAFLFPNMYTYFADFGALAIQFAFQKISISVNSVGRNSAETRGTLTKAGGVSTDEYRNRGQNGSFDKKR